jgi:hypothetical protein
VIVEIAEVSGVGVTASRGGRGDRHGVAVIVVVGPVDERNLGLHPLLSAAAALAGGAAEAPKRRLSIRPGAEVDTSLSALPTGGIKMRSPWRTIRYGALIAVRSPIARCCAASGC